jgi:hypothetical protein
MNNANAMIPDAVCSSIAPAAGTPKEQEDLWRDVADLFDRNEHGELIFSMDRFC